MQLKLNYDTAVLRICLDRTEAGDLAGQVFSRRLRAPIRFADSNGLIVQLDTLMDQQRFPQAFQRHRTFSDDALDVPAARAPEEMMSAETVANACGRLGTFLLYVSSRRNSTWQGFVDLLDGSGRLPFSSTLEFLKLIDRRFVLGGGQDGGGAGLCGGGHTGHL